MKRLVIMMIMLLCLSCCSKKEEHIWVDYSYPYEKYFVTLPEDPRERDDIFINANDGFYNTEFWDAFLNAVDAGKDAEVTVARFTFDGKVIYELLKFEGGKFFLYVDDSRDPHSRYESHKYERMWLYEYSFIRDEDISGTVSPYYYRYCFLSDQLFESEEEAQLAVDEWFMGKQSEIIVVWADSARYEN